MKAQDLYAGYEYAWYGERPKGVETPLNACKVRMIRVIRRKADLYNERLSTFAEVEFLEDSNVPNYKGYGYRKGDVQEVRARDIVDYWDDYHDREEAALEERRQTERRRQEAIAAEAAHNQSIVERFAKQGLDVTVTSMGNVTIPRTEAVRWLIQKENEYATQR